MEETPNTETQEPVISDIENKPDVNVEEKKDESFNLIPNALAAAERLEKANKESKELVERLERLKSIQLLGGYSEGAPQEIKKSPQDEINKQALEILKRFKI